MYGITSETHFQQIFQLIKNFAENVYDRGTDGAFFFLQVRKYSVLYKHSDLLKTNSTYKKLLQVGIVSKWIRSQLYEWFSAERFRASELQATTVAFSYLATGSYELNLLLILIVTYLKKPITFLIISLI